MKCHAMLDLKMLMMLIIVNIIIYKTLNNAIEIFKFERNLKNAFHQGGRQWK